MSTCDGLPKPKEPSALLHNEHNKLREMATVLLSKNIVIDVREYLSAYCTRNKLQRTTLAQGLNLKKEKLFETIIDGTAFPEVPANRF